MTLSRVSYRIQQFWNTLLGNTTPPELDEDACQYLPGELLALFRKMQPVEQAHSLEVFRTLVEQGENHPDLLTAALLHDSGKSQLPLSLSGRVAVVLGKRLFPRYLERVGNLQAGHTRGWQRAFQTAIQHPRWGAELAEAAGATPLACALIGRHQEKVRVAGQSLEDRLLAKLQEVDDNH